MPLSNEVFAICQRLSNKGWAHFLSDAAGLKINQPTKEALAKELARPLIFDPEKRTGYFPDFAAEGVRAIEPGKPAYSLLLHAIAYPLAGDGRVTAFPTLDEIEIIENYIYSLHRPTIAQLRERAGNAPLALVVYAAEYRPAIQTVHGKHADMCFSRTGVARVGTAAERYVGEARGYDSLSDTVNRRVHVVPCRYSAYIAARMKGDPDSFGPLRPHGEGEVDNGGQPITPDKQRNFWVPLHKIFSGKECLEELNLNLSFKTCHHNEKLRRLHLFLESQGLKSEYSGTNLMEFPFIIPEAKLIAVQYGVKGSSMTVVPIPRASLVDEAYFHGKRLGFQVPAGGADHGGAFKIPVRPSGGKRAPEYMYVRRKIVGNKLKDLNGDPDMLRTINLGGYRAQLYFDWTGDGWVKALCPELANEIPQSLPAYSILAAPDFLPKVKQQDVQDWWKQSTPPEIRATLFPDFKGSNPTEPLSDTRIAPNISFRHRIGPMKDEPVFDSTDDSYTAIVSLPGSGGGTMTGIRRFDDHRVSPLPDGASGLFAPGWDVSVDQTDDEKSSLGIRHLAGYGGALPFIEDSRLCAAMSAFWPAVAPDAARVYEPGLHPSVTPLPDRRLEWDQLKRPEIVRRPVPGRPGVVRFHAYAYADYVQSALNNRFDFKKIGSVSVKKYELWTLLMARVYQSLRLRTTAEKAGWAVVTFHKASANDPDLKYAQKATGRVPEKPYRFFLILPSGIEHGPNPRFVHAVFRRYVLAFATSEMVLYRDTNNAGWLVREF